jgi:hypothetical protein
MSLIAYSRVHQSFMLTITIALGHWVTRKGKKVSENLLDHYARLFSSRETPADDQKILNLALKDQLTALEWVQANIGNFGGDKSKVRTEALHSIVTGAHTYSIF